MSKKEKKINKGQGWGDDVKLDIPEDEIWTYQVPGLAAPHINKPYKNYGIKKVIFALVIIVAVSLSMYFSIRTVQSDTFDYADVESGIQFEKFSNTGFIKELDIDYVMEVVYDEKNTDVNTNFSFKKDTTKPITEIREFALNCDEKVVTINIGKDVQKIDGKSFYSCWALQCINVDEENQYYSSIDGVLYNKDQTEIICVPTDHDTYLAEKYGYAKYNRDNYRVEPTQDGYDIDGTIVPFDEGKSYEGYEKDVLTYVIPSTVTKVGELCFNYSNMTTVYIPEGVTHIADLGFYEIPKLANIYSYVADAPVKDTHFNGVESLGKVYYSLPEGLEHIGSDAFTQCQALTYMYIPASVNEIEHHAFWDTCYKQDGNVVGVSVMNVAHSEEAFSSVATGDNWRPQYDYLLFKKSIDINYSAERQPIPAE